MSDFLQFHLNVTFLETSALFTLRYAVCGWNYSGVTLEFHLNVTFIEASAMFHCPVCCLRLKLVLSVTLGFYLNVTFLETSVKFRCPVWAGCRDSGPQITQVRTCKRLCMSGCRGWNYSVKCHFGVSFKCHFSRSFCYVSLSRMLSSVALRMSVSGLPWIRNL